MGVAANMKSGFRPSRAASDESAPGKEAGVRSCAHVAAPHLHTSLLKISALGWCWARRSFHRILVRLDDERSFYRRYGLARVGIEGR
jgi:hypothetical protein